MPTKKQITAAGAAAMAAARWAKTTPAERSKIMAAVSAGRMKKISPRRRREIATKASQAAADARRSAGD